jgi:hypothetical protein
MVECFEYRVTFSDGYEVRFLSKHRVDGETHARLVRRTEQGFGPGHPLAPVRSVICTTWVRDAVKGAGHDKTA